MGMPELGREAHHVMGGERLARADALEARFIRASSTHGRGVVRLGLELRLPFAIVPDMQQVLSWPVSATARRSCDHVGDRTAKRQAHRSISPRHRRTSAGAFRTRRAQLPRVLSGAKD